VTSSTHKSGRKSKAATLTLLSDKSKPQLSRSPAAATMP